MTLLHPTSTRPPVLPRTLSIAYTPDSDDVFNFYAWEYGRIMMPDVDAEFERNHISVLNHAAAAGLYDVVNVSSVMYPVLADRYRILAVGTSVGRGYGPVLVAAQPRSIDSLAGCRIGVADISTTGGFLADWYGPTDTELVAMPYHRIVEAISRGEIDAGVMIHEELVHFPNLGMHCVADLGRTWSDDTGLPLPVGLNLVRRRLGLDTAREIVRTCRASLAWAMTHQEEAMAHANRFGRGRAEDFVPMFSNEDTLRFPADVRQGLELLMERVAESGLAPSIAPEDLEIVDA